MKDIKKIIEKYSALMTAAEDYIWHNPEVGYREYKTDKYMADAFVSLGYKIERYEGVTGFVAYYDTGREGPTVLVLAELDALYCSTHESADKETGAAHVCGHNAQCASVLGVAAALMEHGADFGLSGRVKFCIVPAEEGVDITWRSSLIEQGLISFTSGKTEYIARGLLSDVDAAFMIHLENGEGSYEGGYRFNVGGNGVIRKKIEITGRASHAGGAPWDGINALYAAELVLAACNALRETFKESDCIRFHPIITKGGESVNAIPEVVVIESYVRGSNRNGLRAANKRINRAIAGACLAMGAAVKISDSHGSEPRLDDSRLIDLMYGAAAELAGMERCVIDNTWTSSSTDMGDISALVPSVHGYTDGLRGAIHDRNYTRLPPKDVCVSSASLQLASIIKLLEKGGEACLHIKKNFKSPYSSPEEFIADKKEMGKTREPITYITGGVNITFD